MHITEMFTSIANGTDAVRFDKLMSIIWDADPQNMYDDWHNARKAAERLGAKKGNGQYVDRQSCWRYVFPDGSIAYISTGGGMVSMPRHIRGRITNGL